MRVKEPEKKSKSSDIQYPKTQTSNRTSGSGSSDSQDPSKSKSSDIESKKTQTNSRKSASGSSDSQDPSTNKSEVALASTSNTRGYQLKRRTQYSYTSKSDTDVKNSWRSDESNYKKYRSSPDREYGNTMENKRQTTLSNRYKAYLSTRNYSKDVMSPDEFQNFVEKGKNSSEEVARKTSFCSRQSRPVDNKSRYYMNGKYAWKNFVLSSFEPRIFFNKTLRKIYMKKTVLNCVKEKFYSQSVKEQWIEKSVLLQQAVDAEWESEGNLDEHSVDLQMLTDDFQFPVANYMKWFEVDMDEFVGCVQDYIRCRREGIPVLKLELNLYQKHAKYLWSPVNLTNSKERVKFTKEMQQKRMSFILSDHIVYVKEDTMFRQKWLKWRNPLLKFCLNFLAYDWPEESRDTNRPNYLKVKGRLLQHTGFPLSLFHIVDDQFDIIEHLVDFIFCLHFGIEIEKTWSHEFRGKPEYLEASKRKDSKRGVGESNSSTRVDSERRVEESNSSTRVDSKSVEDTQVNKTSKSSTHKKDYNNDEYGIDLDDKLLSQDVRLNMICGKGMSSDIVSEDIIEKEDLSKKDLILQQLNIYRNIYCQLDPNNQLTQRYARIVNAQYEFEEKYLSRLRKSAMEEYKTYMDCFFVDILARNPGKSANISKAKLKAMLDEGIKLMLHLHLHRGYNLGLLEDAIQNDDEDKTKGSSRYEERCCFCPLHSTAVKNSLRIPDNRFLTFGNYVSIDCCHDNKAMSRETLIGHLCLCGFGNGCHMHLAALIYTKHICLITKKDIHAEHKNKIIELEAQFNSRPKIFENDEEGDGNVTPRNDMEVDE